jgi:hypothetical protein
MIADDTNSKDLTPQSSIVVKEERVSNKNLKLLKDLESRLESIKEFTIEYYVFFHFYSLKDDSEIQ